MPRDISDAMSDEIAIMIKGSFDTLPEFAEACKLEHSEVYSILVRSGGSRAIEAIERLMEKGKCSYQMAADVYRAAPGPKRKAALNKIAKQNKWTLRQLSEICWGHRQHIHSIIRGSSGSKQAPNLVRVMDALKVDLQQFKILVKQSVSAA